MGRVSMLNARAGGLLERPGRHVGHTRARGSLSLRSFIPAVTQRQWSPAIFLAGILKIGYKPIS
jgi:hypothetical protein